MYVLLFRNNDWLKIYDFNIKMFKLVFCIKFGLFDTFVGNWTNVLDFWGDKFRRASLFNGGDERDNEIG